jgi:DtxR family Mn-dependent transcriptional regulator
MPGYNQIDSALGDVRRLSREGKHDTAVLKKLFQDKYGDDLTQTLKQKDYATIQNKKIYLTPLGEKRADNFLRKYHLAKKFANDILEVPYEELETFTLDLQEIFTETITDRICTFLGHPQWGLSRKEPIVPGKCCGTISPEVSDLVIPVTKLPLGEEATVAYVSTRTEPVLQQLMQFGIYPGVVVRVTSAAPAYILQCEEHQVALEEKVAKGIYVRR